MQHLRLWYRKLKPRDKAVFASGEGAIAFGVAYLAAARLFVGPWLWFVAPLVLAAGFATVARATWPYRAPDAFERVRSNARRDTAGRILWMLCRSFVAAAMLYALLLVAGATPFAFGVGAALVVAAASIGFFGFYAGVWTSVVFAALAVLAVKHGIGIDPTVAADRAWFAASWRSGLVLSWWWPIGGCLYAVGWIVMAGFAKLIYEQATRRITAAQAKAQADAKIAARRKRMREINKANADDPLTKAAAAKVEAANEARRLLGEAAKPSRGEGERQERALKVLEEDLRPRERCAVEEMRNLVATLQSIREAQSRFEAEPDEHAELAASMARIEHSFERSVLGIRGDHWRLIEHVEGGAGLLEYRDQLKARGAGLVATGRTGDGIVVATNEDLADALVSHGYEPEYVFGPEGGNSESVDGSLGDNLNDFGLPTPGSIDDGGAAEVAVEAMAVEAGVSPIDVPTNEPAEALVEAGEEVLDGKGLLDDMPWTRPVPVSAQALFSRAEANQASAAEADDMVEFEPDADAVEPVSAGPVLGGERIKEHEMGKVAQPVPGGRRVGKWEFETDEAPTPAVAVEPMIEVEAPSSIETVIPEPGDVLDIETGVQPIAREIEIEAIGLVMPSSPKAESPPAAPAAEPVAVDPARAEILRLAALVMGRVLGEDGDVRAAAAVFATEAAFAAALSLPVEVVGEPFASLAAANEALVLADALESACADDDVDAVLHLIERQGEVIAARQSGVKRLAVVRQWAEARSAEIARSGIAVAVVDEKKIDAEPSEEDLSALDRKLALQIGVPDEFLARLRADLPLLVEEAEKFEALIASAERRGRSRAGNPLVAELEACRREISIIANTAMGYTLKTARLAIERVLNDVGLVERGGDAAAFLAALVDARGISDASDEVEPTSEPVPAARAAVPAAVPAVAERPMPKPIRSGGNRLDGRTAVTKLRTSITRVVPDGEVPRLVETKLSNEHYTDTVVWELDACVIQFVVAAERSAFFRYDVDEDRVHLAEFPDMSTSVRSLSNFANVTSKIGALSNGKVIGALVLISPGLTEAGRQTFEALAERTGHRLVVLAPEQIETDYLYELSQYAQSLLEG